LIRWCGTQGPIGFSATLISEGITERMGFFHSMGVKNETTANLRVLSGVIT